MPGAFVVRSFCSLGTKKSFWDFCCRVFVAGAFVAVAFVAWASVTILGRKVKFKTSEMPSHNDFAQQLLSWSLDYVTTVLNICISDRTYKALRHGENLFIQRFLFIH